MLYIGTSGFSYDDWRGPWYPPNLTRAHFFDYYAERFRAVEINSTFYHIYSPRMMESLVRRASGRLVFAVKMSELITHHGILDRRVVLSYAAGIEPAARENVLAAVLLQFPQRFHFTRENRVYLDRVRQAFHFMPLVLEIRHDSWQSAEAWQYLTDQQISLSLLDMPDLPRLPRPSTRRSGPIGYMRFHGRNAYQWHRAEYPGARYHYLYSRAELEPWADQILAMEREAATALIFFNIHLHAQAAANAAMFMERMGQTLRAPSYEDMFSSVKTE